MIIAKYLLDENNPYIMEHQLRTGNPDLAHKFIDKSEAKRLMIQYGYNLDDIELMEVEDNGESI
jgi:hypothetical protein